MTRADAGAKATAGRFLEDFSVGEVLRHAVPRTVTLGDVALYQSIHGARFAVQASDTFARSIGYPAAPVDDLLVLHAVVARTAPDLSANALAGLGLADCRFVRTVFPGDTLSATSEVIGLDAGPDPASGILFVRSVGRNQRGEVVIELARWLVLRKRSFGTAAAPVSHPGNPAALPDRVEPAALGAAVPPVNPYTYDRMLAGGRHIWSDYEPGERIDHIDGVRLGGTEHGLAAGALTGGAPALHPQQPDGEGRLGLHGGVALSLARMLTFNGLANAFHVAAINRGRHLAAQQAGDTVYAWSEVLERAEVPGRRDIGALRLRTIATRNLACTTFPLPVSKAPDAPGAILDLDYWVVMPR